MRPTSRCRVSSSLNYQQLENCSYSRWRSSLDWMPLDSSRSSIQRRLDLHREKLGLLWDYAPVSCWGLPTWIPLLWSVHKSESPWISSCPLEECLCLDQDVNQHNQNRTRLRYYQRTCLGRRGMRSRYCWTTSIDVCHTGGILVRCSRNCRSMNWRSLRLWWNSRAHLQHWKCLLPTWERFAMFYSNG